MAHKKPSHIHVLLRGAEAGGITKADIERRARELALIRSNSENYTDADLEAAARELLGSDRTPAATSDDAETDVAVSRDPSEARSVTGRQVQNNPSDTDENEDPERLAIQGVEEAQHDQMVQARRTRRGGSSSG